MYTLNWNDVPETENLKNNFRVAVAGKEMGINRIRWVHPTSLPDHTHDDAEQVIIMLEGEIKFTIDGEQLHLRPGDVTVVPRHAHHSGESIAGEAVFVEVFAPLRIENLFGFLGGAGMPKQES
jgi:quercetin dioxygenase-like cupin family protein